jgi:hypothetical protein
MIKDIIIAFLVPLLRQGGKLVRTESPMGGTLRRCCSTTGKTGKLDMGLNRTPFMENL